MHADDLLSEFHEAVNAADAGRLAGLATEDIEVGGPRGTGRGIDLLRGWVDRAGIHLTPVRTFRHGDTVVIAQRARWGADGRPYEIATLFRIRDERIAAAIRYDDLASALSAAGLSDTDGLNPMP